MDVKDCLETLATLVPITCISSSLLDDEDEEEDDRGSLVTVLTVRCIKCDHLDILLLGGRLVSGVCLCALERVANYSFQRDYKNNYPFHSWHLKMFQKSLAGCSSNKAASL